MGSRKRVIRLERKVLQAAALGSVKLLRTLLHSHARPSRKEQRKSRKRRRQDDRKSADRDSHREKKRSRKAEKREQRKIYKRGRDRDSREVGEGRSSDAESEDFDRRDEEEIRHSKRARREEGGENTANERHGVPNSEDGQTKEDYSSSSLPVILKSMSGLSSNDRGSSGKESNDGSRTESDIEEVSPRRPERKHNAASGETVRNIVNCRDAEGLSPLHHACHAGSESLVKYLISKGASVHARDSKGDTPLHIAAKLGPASLVATLKDAGADAEAFNDQGVTPSDILDKKEAAARRVDKFKDQQKWHTHLADELSDNEDAWWGTEWGEESERPDWEDPILERMAESRQGRGLYNEPFSLRDFLKAEKNKTQSEQDGKSKRKGRRADRPVKDDKGKSPEEVVIGPTLKVSVQTQSYRQRWKTFAESYNLCLSYSSVPFPTEEGKEDTLGEVLLQGINPSTHRATLREEMLKWHPDKFLQKWGAKLQGPDHDKIVARVNEVSEAIHQLYKNLTPAK